MRIAVTGATGRLGGQIASLLAADPAHHVRLLSRRELARASRPPRVSTALADYSKPETLRAALRDIDTLVFVSSDGEATQVLIHHQNVIWAAARSGVSHIVALSTDGAMMSASAGIPGGIWCGRWCRPQNSQRTVIVA